MNDQKLVRMEFKTVRKQYLKTVPNKCVRCKETGNLHVHHKVAIQDGGTNHYNNLCILCIHCHKEWHLIEQRNASITFENFLKMPNLFELYAMMFSQDSNVDIRVNYHGLNMTLEQTVGTFRQFREGLDQVTFDD